MPTARDDTQFVYLLARRFATRDPVVRATPEFTKALHHCQSIWGCGYESKKMRPDCGTFCRHLLAAATSDFSFFTGLLDFARFLAVRFDANSQRRKTL